MELCFFTLAVGGHRPPLLVAGLAHPDRPAAPASLRHRHPVAGARVAEALAARPAVVLPLRLLEHFPTAVTNLRWGRGRWEGGGWIQRRGHIIMASASPSACQHVHDFPLSFKGTGMFTTTVTLLAAVVLTVISALGLQYGGAT